MNKLDLSKKYKNYYSAKAKPEIIDVEKASFLSIEGQGDPSSERFAKSIEALYSVAYTVKFAAKALDRDFVVSKLEGLWWFDEAKFGNPSPAEAPLKIPRSEWHYRLLLRLPDYVTAEQVEQGVAAVFAKKQLQRAKDVAFYTTTEGKCIQALHTGSFDTEPATIEKLMAFCDAHGFQKNGHHHEIYLSDFRKTLPEKLRTILREPVK